MEDRLYYINSITDLLARLVSRVQIAVRGNRADINIIAENILCGLLNRIHGWSLKNANAIRQNFPGVDLVDTVNRVAVQVTSSNTLKKLRHTLVEFDDEQMKRDFDSLILLIITNDLPTRDMNKIDMKPWFTGEKDIWNIPRVMRQIEDLEELDRLRRIDTYLKEQMGALDKAKYCLPTVPLASASFVPGSRDRELEELRTRLEQAGTVFLCGVGGIGKTEVAIQLAKNHAPAAGAYFLRYSGSMRWTILQTRIEGYRFEGTDDERRKGEYRDRLRVLREYFQGALVIVDNWDGENLHRMLAEEACQDLMNLGLRLVFTTRFPMDGGVSVGPMEEDDLLRLMRRSYGRKSVPDEELRTLIRAVGGHTLMVDLMAKTLREMWGDTAPEKMRKALHDSDLDRKEFPEVVSDQDRKYQQKQIYAHMKALFDLSGLKNRERAVLRCATLLPADGMNDELFRDCLPEEQHQTLRNLINRGWIRHEDDLLAIHPVIREVCRGELAPDDRGCKPFLDTLHKRTDKRDYDADRFWQAASCLSVAAGHLEDYWGDRAYQAAEVWSSIGQCARALPYALQAVERRKARQVTTGGRRQQKIHDMQLASAYHMAARIYSRLSEYQQSRDLGRLALELRQTWLPAGDFRIARSHSVLGVACSHLGEHDDALRHLELALQMHESMEKPNQGDIASCYNNIGNAHDAAGHFELALENRRKGLEIRLALYADKPNHPDVAASLNNVGRSYDNLGRYDEALDYELRALQIRSRRLHTDDPERANSYYNVGHTYGRKGQYPEAVDYLDRALDIWEQFLPPDHERMRSAREERETYRQCMGQPV